MEWTGDAKVWLVILLVTLSGLMANADFIETFSNGSDDGDWHLTDNPDRLLRIEPGGGNPGAYLHGQVFTPVPVWYVPFGTSPTHFLGNYYAQNVSGISSISTSSAEPRHHNAPSLLIC